MKRHKYTKWKSTVVFIDLRLIPIYPHGDNGKILRLRIYRWTFKWRLNCG